MVYNIRIFAKCHRYYTNIRSIVVNVRNILNVILEKK